MQSTEYTDDYMALMLKSLNPDAVKIDGRSLRDYLAFIAKYSELVLYYNSNNKVTGNWFPFLAKDPIILLAHISKTEFFGIHSRFVKLKQCVCRSKELKELAKSNDEPVSDLTMGGLANYINPIFHLLQEVFSRINGWVNYMLNGSSAYQLQDFVIKKVSDTIASKLWEMINIQRRLSIVSDGLVAQPDDNEYQNFNSLWFETVKSDPVAGSQANHKHTNRSCYTIFDIELKSIWDIYHDVFGFFIQVIEYSAKEFSRLCNNKSDHPDTSLLIAAAKMVEQQKENLNSFSEKHLDFYYKDVLRLSPKKAVADSAYVTLELVLGAKELMLPAGTKFNAGTYPDKTEIVFSSDSDIELNEAKIGDIYTQFYVPAELVKQGDNKTINKYNNADQVPPGLYITKIEKANTIKLDQNKQVLDWSCFGDTDGEKVGVGFSVASPMLFLQSGIRIITITFLFKQNINLNYFSGSRLYLSTEKAWYQVPGADVAKIVCSNKKNISYQIILPESAPAIVKFNKNPDGVVSNWPMLKVMLGDSVDLQNPPELASVIIDTAVENLKGYVQGNDKSLLPNSGPALIYGPIPAVGDRYYIGSNEIFAKPISQIHVKLNWDNIEADFAKYYEQYNDFLDQKNNTTKQYFFNTAFSGYWSMLKDNSWSFIEPVSAEGTSKKSAKTSPEIQLPYVPLFQQTDVKNTQPPPPANMTINSSASNFIFSLESSGFSPDPELLLTPLPAITTANSGYIRFQLCSPQYAFGHSLYPKVVSSVSLSNAQKLIKESNKYSILILFRLLVGLIKKDLFGKSSSGVKKSDLLPMPNQGYSPKIESLNLIYDANAKTDFSLTSKQYPFEYYHHSPLATYQVYDSQKPSDSLAGLNLIPGKNNISGQSSFVPLFSGVGGAGCMFLGIKDVAAPCTVTLLIELNQNADINDLSTKGVGYYFWSKNGWTELTILSDKTYDLTCTGLIKFEVPNVISNESDQSDKNTYYVSPQMPIGQFWIAITTEKKNIKAKIVYIDTQALEVTRQNMSSLPEGMTPQISANAIVSTTIKHPKISKISQPFDSFGGAAAENNESFRKSVSLRIGNKDRAVNANDYEGFAHIACSNIYYAKVIKEEVQANKTSINAPGVIRIGLVKSYTNYKQVNAFEPSVSACDQMKVLEYIKARVSPMATVNVFNFKHVYLTVKAKILITQDANSVLIEEEANHRLKMYLSPWIDSTSPQTRLQYGVSRSALFSLITELAGVLSVDDFQILLSESKLDNNEAKPIMDEIIKSGRSDCIIVSAIKHQLELVSVQI